MYEKGYGDPKIGAVIKGWSYGGYSAMVGSMRDPNPWRCAITGAGVSDVELVLRQGRRGAFTRVYQEPTIRGAYEPIDNVDSIDVPILVIQGTADRTVEVSQGDLFVEALRKHGKAHKYLRLDGVGHSPNNPKHRLPIYKAWLKFLANDCGLPTDRNPGSGRSRSTVGVRGGSLN